MKHPIRWAISALALALPAGALQASGDYGCSVSWKLPSRDFDCANRAVLSPGNDSRVNLLYLLRDRQAVPANATARPKREYDDVLFGNNFFDWGELRATFYPAAASDETEVGGDRYGSRCISLASGGEAFGAAMAANAKLPAGERSALASARGFLVARCDGHKDLAPAWPSGIKSAPGKEFLGYLQAAEAFYGEEWEAARQGFARLRAARDPWVAEASAYMLPRTELNAAQAAAFDEYGSFAGAGKVDGAALARARSGFGDYLRRHAQGRYAASAQGLGRRALWLGGDVGGLSREYERLLGVTPAARESAADLVEEIDNKLLVVPGSRGGIDGPLLLATADLMMMRRTEDTEWPVITAEQIAAQKPRFAGRDDLHGFVLANHAFYVANDPRQVLRLIPDDARQPRFSAVQFSRQVLRGMALAALKDRNEAGFWREMLGGADAVFQRPAVELGLAMNWERNGKLAEVFAPGSPIGEVAIREILLIAVAGPDLLRAQAKASGRPEHERDVALFTLLEKQLVYGDYAGFLGDLALLGNQPKSEEGLWNIRQQAKVPLALFRSGATSDGYACPALRATAQALQRNPRDARARLCLGDFYRLNGFDDALTSPERPKPDELGGTPTQFRGRAAPRSVIYADVIADPSAPAGEKAYALYRAVNCYAPTGGNQCGGADVPQGQRQAWFQRLKRDYPASEWAKKLRYYW